LGLLTQEVTVLVLGALRCGKLAFNHDSSMTSYKWLSPGTVDRLGMGNSWRGARFRDGGAEAIARERGLDLEVAKHQWGGEGE
jgi:hypothetical protein